MQSEVDIDMEPSSKAWPGTCSRGVVARGKTVGKRLEAIQDWLGRKLLGANRTVAGEALHVEMGWKKRGDVVWAEILGARRREVGEAAMHASRKIERFRWCRLEGRIQDVAEKVRLGGSQRGRVRVSSSLEEENRKTELERLARRGGQEK